jgi:hypothetical protein
MLYQMGSPEKLANSLQARLLMVTEPSEQGKIRREDESLRSAGHGDARLRLPTACYGRVIPGEWTSGAVAPYCASFFFPS